MGFLNLRTEDRSSFKWNVLKLSSSTAVGQLLLLLAAPILTRLFPVDAFGQLSVLQSLSALFQYVATGRYEMAILVPEDDITALDVFHVAICVVCCTSATTFFGYVLLSHYGAFTGKFAFVEAYGWVVSLTQLFGGFYLCFSHLAMRKKSFSRLACSRITAVTGTLSTQLGVGLSFCNRVGLFLGEPIGLLFRTIPLAAERHSQGLFQSLYSGRLSGAAKRYSAYPLFGTWGILLSSLWTLHIANSFA